METSKQKSTPKPNWAVWVGLCVVILCSCYELWTTTHSYYVHNPDTDLRYHWKFLESGVPSDGEIILTGITNKTSFSETGTFWTGVWAAGPNWGYYRPLPSTLWWLMYHNWGPNSLAAFLVVLAVSHLLATVLLWGFLSDLFKSTLMGTVAIAFWLLGVAESLFTFTANRAALIFWVDHIEVWSALTIIGAVWCFLRYVRSDERKWMYGSAAIFVLGVTIKEMSYIVPIMAPLVLWHEGRLSQWRKTLPLWALTAFAVAYRFWALQGTHLPRTGNGSWWSRAFTETATGGAGALLLRHETLPFAVACCVLLALCIITRRAFKWKLAWLALAVVFTALSAWFSRDLDDPFYLQLLGGKQVWIAAFFVTLWMLLMWNILTFRNRSQWFGWGWVVISYLPLLLAPNTAHIFYIPSIGWSIVVAFAARDLGVAIAKAFPRSEPELQTSKQPYEYA